MKPSLKKIVLSLFFLNFLTSYALVRDPFAAPFNPMMGMVKADEKKFREEICLNGSWQFMPVYNATASDFNLPSQFTWENTKIKIPSPWDVNNYTNRYGKGGDFITYPSYPAEWINAKIGWMKKEVEIPADWNKKALMLHFEGILGKSIIYVNGQKVKDNFEFFLPFEMDVSQYLTPGKKNEILVGVARGSLYDIPGKNGTRPYVSGSFWGTDMAGIWQDVYLFAYPQVYVEVVFIQPDVSKSTIKVEVEIRNTTDQPQVINVSGDVKQWINKAGRGIIELPEEKWELSKQKSLTFPSSEKLTIAPKSAVKVKLTKKVDSELDYWTPETPNLYGLLIYLSNSKTTFDIKYERFGWRQFSIKGKDLLLNGKRIELRGDSWHFMGVPQMTRRYAWGLYDMLKAANANAVRFHAQPYPSFYMDLADEMGICVLDETAIWASDGGPKIDSEEYWMHCESHLRKLIRRDKNHASVFGWSVCNETIPVCLYVYRTPDELLQRQIKEINKWVKITKELDPTRDWISGDGETERNTDLPTNLGHYGDEKTIEYWASLPLPWGIGEQGMAYYASPKQVSKINGNRAYESALGRMEGVAMEAYDLINKQRANKAAYSCVFNLAWYALQPLPLGKTDITSKPSLKDGIFFRFSEGTPGIQPERLGPYTTVFNPGYDNTLPLYKTWPLFDAVTNAFATPIKEYSIPGKIQESPLMHEKVIRKTMFLGSEKSALWKVLDQLGLNTVLLTSDLKGALLIVDGKDLSLSVNQWTILKNGIQEGAIVFVMGISPESIEKINAVLPYPVSIESREATSFLKLIDSPVLSGLNHSDFYFTELLGEKGGKAMTYGLTGDFVNSGTTLVEACQTDWGKWIYSMVPTKTAAVIRSERETKGSRSAIVSLKSKEGEIILSSIDFDSISKDAESLMRCLLSNLGSTFSNEKVANIKALNSTGFVQNALICGAFNSIGKTIPEMMATDYLGNISTIKPQLGDRSIDKFWNMIGANDNNIFELRNARISGSNENAVVYLSFWFYSPRSLSDLLIEPDMPILNMYVNTHHDFDVVLNGKPIAPKVKVMQEGTAKLTTIPVEKGWNHFIVKIVRGPGEGAWDTTIKFDCVNNGEYMKQVLSSVAR
jgi:beta-galactosidase